MTPFSARHLTPRGVALCDQISAVLRDRPGLTSTGDVHRHLADGGWRPVEVRSGLDWLHLAGRAGHLHATTHGQGCWWWHQTRSEDRQTAIAVRQIEQRTQKGHGT